MHVPFCRALCRFCEYTRVKSGDMYCLFDSDTGKVEFRRLPFDAEAYAEAMRAQGAEIPFWLEDMLKA